jgi:hypothetical protein
MHRTIARAATEPSGDSGSIRTRPESTHVLTSRARRTKAVERAPPLRRRADRPSVGAQGGATRRVGRKRCERSERDSPAPVASPEAPPAASPEAPPVAPPVPRHRGHPADCSGRGSVRSALFTQMLDCLHRTSTTCPGRLRGCHPMSTALPANVWRIRVVGCAVE